MQHNVGVSLAIRDRRSIEQWLRNTVVEFVF
jgi:hypothetical protein